MLKKDLRLSPARRLSFQASPSRRLFGVGRCLSPVRLPATKLSN